MDYANFKLLEDISILLPYQYGRAYICGYKSLFDLNMWPYCLWQKVDTNTKLHDYNVSLKCQNWPVTTGLFLLSDHYE